MIIEILKFLVKQKEIDVKNLDVSTVKNILVVKQHNQLGDMLCSLPLMAALKNKFPDSKITLLTSPQNIFAINKDSSSYVDEVLLYDKSSFFKIFSLVFQLRSKEFDIGIVPSLFSFSFTSHFINYLSGARIKVGVKKIDGNFNKYEFLLNVKSEYRWGELKVHQTERNTDIAKQLGCELSNPDKRNIRTTLSEDNYKFAENYFANNFIDKYKPVIAYHPGAGKRQNRWAVEKFAELSRLIHHKYNNYTLITCGPIDYEVTESLNKLLESMNIDASILKGSSLREDEAILSKVDLFITNDTGIMHAAAFVNAKVLALFGPTNGFEWGPVNENGYYIQSESNDINDISVETVFDKVCSIIELNNKKKKQDKI